jgi:class 3 adenylate cyclase
LVNEINNCYTEFDKIIIKYNIEKIKTIGDSYMCASGLPLESDNHASNMIKAAREIKSFMRDLQEKRKSHSSPFFKISIGIHSGSVVAGIVGLKKFAYDIWGDTVNIASRMESFGEAGQINISEATYQLINNEFDCTMRVQTARINDEEFRMYFVS